MLHCSCFIKIYHNSSSVLCRFRKSNTSWIAMDFVLSESSWHGSNFHATLTSWSSFSCPYQLMFSSQHPCSSSFLFFSVIFMNRTTRRGKFGKHQNKWALAEEQVWQMLIYIADNVSLSFLVLDISVLLFSFVLPSLILYLVTALWSLNFTINWLSIVYLTYLSFMKLYALLYLSVCSILAPAVCF